MRAAYVTLPPLSRLPQSSHSHISPRELSSFLELEDSSAMNTVRSLLPTTTRRLRLLKIKKSRLSPSKPDVRARPFQERAPSSPRTPPRKCDMTSPRPGQSSGTRRPDARQSIVRCGAVRVTQPHLVASTSRPTERRVRMRCCNASPDSTAMSTITVRHSARAIAQAIAELQELALALEAEDTVVYPVYEHPRPPPPYTPEPGWASRSTVCASAFSPDALGRAEPQTRMSLCHGDDDDESPGQDTWVGSDGYLLESDCVSPVSVTSGLKDPEDSSPLPAALPDSPPFVTRSVSLVDQDDATGAGAISTSPECPWFSYRPPLPADWMKGDSLSEPPLIKDKYNGPTATIVPKPKTKVSSLKLGERFSYDSISRELALLVDPLEALGPHEVMTGYTL